MQLDMKTNCERCGRALAGGDPAYICSFECTFCPECASAAHGTCPNCGGELLRRPRRTTVLAPNAPAAPSPVGQRRPWLIWAVSFAVWAAIALVASFTIYQFDRLRGMPTHFLDMLGLELAQVLSYAPLTPLAFGLAVRYPFRRDKWASRTLLYLAGGIVFSFAHVLLRALTYPAWDNNYHRIWIIWDFTAHAPQVRWHFLESLFFINIVDDITGTYAPILLVAHAISYYQGLRERELRTSQLQEQLAKAQLRALKSQLQPHFLFNTLHSISALMLTDVSAADRMMTRLSDLLRMVLEDAGTQITTLSREVELVNCYLEIEKIRFEERLKVKFDIAPETLDALVPHLLLQPLVDNAVKHGVSKRLEGGTIHIEASVKDGELYLAVSDNGAGLSTAEMTSAQGLGLRATRERLSTLYGAGQHLELAKLPEGGTSVRIRIPCRLYSAGVGGELASRETA